VCVHQLGAELLAVGGQWERADAKLAAQRWWLTGHDETYVASQNEASVSPDMMQHLVSETDVCVNTR
jgi:hypothetical protein